MIVNIFIRRTFMSQQDWNYLEENKKEIIRGTLGIYPVGIAGIYDRAEMSGIDITEAEAIEMLVSLTAMLECNYWEDVKDVFNNFMEEKETA